MMFYAKRNFVFIFITIQAFGIPAVLSLECFVCHGKRSKECSDPFGGNLNETVDCQRVRDVGMGLLATSAIFGSAPMPYEPLSQAPHVCFKLNMENVLIRGCGKPDVCQNHTDVDCFTCEEDGCNDTSYNTPKNVVLLYSAVIFYTLS